jgi:hypothetical protein
VWRRGWLAHGMLLAGAHSTAQARGCSGVGVGVGGGVGVGCGSGGWGAMSAAVCTR